MIRSSLTLAVFVGAMVLISARLYSRKIDFVKEEVYDMSVYYNNQNNAPPVYNNNKSGLDGKFLFKANCASCHKANKVLIGPGLAGAKQRWTEAGIGDKLYEWVRNPKKVLDEGHPYVIDLVSRFKNQPLMTPQALSDEEIDAVLHYLGYVY